MSLRIRAYRDEDLPDVSALWERCGLLRDGSDPKTHIAQCRGSGRGKVFVAVRAGTTVASVMVGHDDVQGWLHYVAVEPEERGRQLGRRMVRRAERWLRDQHLPRVCLLVREGEDGAVAFYERLGYTGEPRYPNRARLKGGKLLTRVLDG
ncbi:MAG: GNAT family N-acetyltransferase [Acetobacterales bacterium]